MLEHGFGLLSVWLACCCQAALLFCRASSGQYAWLMVLAVVLSNPCGCCSSVLASIWYPCCTLSSSLSTLLLGDGFAEAECLWASLSCPLVLLAWLFAWKWRCYPWLVYGLVQDAISGSACWLVWSQCFLLGKWIPLVLIPQPLNGHISTLKWTACYGLRAAADPCFLAWSGIFCSDLF